MHVLDPVCSESRGVRFGHWSDPAEEMAVQSRGQNKSIRYILCIHTIASRVHRPEKLSQDLSQKQKEPVPRSWKRTTLWEFVDRLSSSSKDGLLRALSSATQLRTADEPRTPMLHEVLPWPQKMPFYVLVLGWCMVAEVHNVELIVLTKPLMQM